MRLDFENISCVYDADTNQPVSALDCVNLSIGENEFIGLIGHTGSGKSTLVQHANGLIKPTSGHVLADGDDIWSEKYDRKALRARVGLVFQYPEHQLFETDILSDVCFGPKNIGKSEGESRELAAEALDQVGIDKDMYGASPFDLSGGQKRRVAIAGVLAMKPEILILDEPTAGLDPRGREEILALISCLREERGITIVLVSHSMEDVAVHAQRILVMDGGKLKYDEPPGILFTRINELEEMGLKAPGTVYILSELKKRGLAVRNTTAVTAKEAAEEIFYTMSCIGSRELDRCMTF